MLSEGKIVLILINKLQMEYKFEIAKISNVPLPKLNTSNHFKRLSSAQFSSLKRAIYLQYI